MRLQLAPDRPPIPPADLILRIAPPFDANNIEASLEAFDVHALGHLHCFERALGLEDRSLSDFDRLLDFGCGCGRFIRHLGHLAGQVEIHGTDIDGEMIDWIRENIPYGQYTKAPHEPPLPYPDQHFDLVINHSVFTHLDERLQDLWLEELRRISSVGALILLTVEGASSWNRLRAAGVPHDPAIARWQTELESRGILFISDDTFIGSTHPDFYHSTFHAPWYVFEHWTRFFDLVAYLPNGSDTQDLVVLRRREEGAEPLAPIRARPRRGSALSTARTNYVSAALARARRYRDARCRVRAGRFRRELNYEAVNRELHMLRAGLYEQGNRISLIAAELRREISAQRDLLAQEVDRRPHHQR